MTHTLDDFEFELREDEVEESVPIEDLLSNCDVFCASHSMRSRYFHGTGRVGSIV